ncbi:EF-hand domain-containing protein [Kitasatospora purpeofusca]|uniref:EF-hand domain-containing protein n=1 Tax=Kitasatospora purpeofusca TaxID=67352 RepID=UPI002A59CD63|nr:EF-hand domain-containing protein [Kitasatospora purpeofusca]MDY0811464.1 EF-hand domain-containing protein [Kitasatospora purpeofusca]
MVTQTERDRFQAMFRQVDGDGDGVIEQVDLDQMVQRTLMQFGAVPGSAHWRRVTDLGNQMWQALQKGADADGDGKVTAREFVAAYRRADFLDQVAIPFELAALETADADNDGRISIAEWLTWQQAKGLSQVEALQEFQQVDSDGDGFLTREECAQHVKQSYTAQ